MLIEVLDHSRNGSHSGSQRSHAPGLAARNGTPVHVDSAEGTEHGFHHSCHDAEIAEWRLDHIVGLLAGIGLPLPTDGVPQQTLELLVHQVVQGNSRLCTALSRCQKGVHVAHLLLQRRDHHRAVLTVDWLKALHRRLRLHLRGEHADSILLVEKRSQHQGLRERGHRARLTLLERAGT